MVGPEGLDVVAVALLLRGELQLKLVLEPFTVKGRDVGERAINSFPPQANPSKIK